MTDTALSPEARQAKIAKITALLQKTVANGCTPEEAASATALANTLMTRFSIAPSECQPQERRRVTTTPPRSGSFEDMFADLFRRAAEEARREQAETRAKAAYRRNGIHVDYDARRTPLYHADCRCASCSARRTRSTTPPPPRPEAPTTGRARRTGPHADCTHEATPSARAKCRRTRGY